MTDFCAAGQVVILEGSTQGVAGLRRGSVVAGGLPTCTDDWVAGMVELPRAGPVRLAVVDRSITASEGFFSIRRISASSGLRSESIVSTLTENTRSWRLLVVVARIRDVAVQKVGSIIEASGWLNNASTERSGSESSAKFQIPNLKQ